MKKVWIVSDSVVSPLGETTDENYRHVRQGESGIRLVNDAAFSPEPFFGGAMQESFDGPFTRFEDMAIRSIRSALAPLTLPGDRTLLILSTTKGNISFLEQGEPDHPRIHLHATAAFLAGEFGLSHYMVVSNACISGVMALIVAKRLINAGKYDHAVVVGADVLSRFVVSGFRSLQALSDEPCQPFDAGRKGINLGECAATIVLTSKPELQKNGPWVSILGGGLSNDANHISGPSRTGEELGFAIQQALDDAAVEKSSIDFISAHGTATLYNDEMEANAFSLTALQDVPVNSMKGYFGHTLGAAGVVEVAMCARSLVENELIASKGFSQLGVSRPVNIIRKMQPRSLTTCLKTASGFGGCNAAVVLQKENNL